MTTKRNVSWVIYLIGAYSSFVATVRLIGDTYVHLVAWCLVKSWVQSSVSGRISYHLNLPTQTEVGGQYDDWPK